MAQAPPKKDGGSVINITYPRQDSIVVHLRGTTPLYHHAVAWDAQKELLLPSRRKNEAERAASVKHDPIREYRESAYKTIGGNHPTRLLMRADALKRALQTAALDTAGVYKTEIGRLVYVVPEHGIYLPVWGVPRLGMAVVRMSDQKRTPDIRTRAICIEWAARATIRYAVERFTPTAIVNLCARAGIFSGWGDYRQEKGTGSAGLWEVVNQDDPQWNAIVKTQGLAAQDRALATPEFFDHDSEALFTWYQEEIVRRGRQQASGPITLRTAKPEAGNGAVANLAAKATKRGRRGGRPSEAQA
jgi:hypothetical protein